MKNVLIASFDMEVGGVERSLITMLNHFDYERFNVDLMLYSHTGDFMDSIPKAPHLLDELLPYKTFRMSIAQTLKKGKISLGISRLIARYKASKNSVVESGYKQMQYMWKYALPFLPSMEQKYDVAISYLWPHYFVAEKVQAKTKIAWIHTDYSIVETDIQLDLQMWNQFNFIIAVSEECKNAFINKYPSLKDKIVVIENIISPDFICSLANENIDNPMLKDTRFKILTVARLSHAKGIDNAVRALKLLKDRGYHDFVWYIVGYGGDETMIRKLIEENGLNDSFILLGKHINPYPFMKAADLYVQPSRYEGKAVTVIEAQILAKPIIITNYSTSRSQLEDGYDGVICDMSPEGIANKIEILYQDDNLRKTLQQNCKQTNYENHNQLEYLYKLINEEIEKKDVIGL